MFRQGEDTRVIREDVLRSQTSPTIATVLEGGEKYTVHERVFGVEKRERSTAGTYLAVVRLKNPLNIDPSELAIGIELEPIAGGRNEGAGEGGRVTRKGGDGRGSGVDVVDADPCGEGADD